MEKRPPMPRLNKYSDSDHSPGSLIALSSVVLGAKMIEKHFTIDHNLPGPDHWFSEDPKSLKNWVSSIRVAYELLGSGELEPTKHELKMRILARRSLVSLKNIKKGDLLGWFNLGSTVILLLPPDMCELKNITKGDKILMGTAIGELMTFKN